MTAFAEVFEVKCADGWTVQVLGEYVREYRNNDDWTQDRQRRLEAKDFRGAVEIAHRLIGLHGGPCTKRLEEPLPIPTMPILMATGGKSQVLCYWLDADGCPAYGVEPGVSAFALSREVHERLLRFVEIQLLPRKKETEQ